MCGCFESRPPTGVDVVGFDVEALDGRIGSVDEATWDVRSGRLVVDTGPWIFGRKVILPAGRRERTHRRVRLPIPFASGLTLLRVKLLAVG